ncbi:MAG: pyruvate kinase [Acidimicrobiia bacterium]
MAARTRRTKIVATIGPACDGRIGDLIAAGVDVFRLNLSHGTIDEHLARLAAIRAAATQASRHIGVLADLPGPKVRSGQFPEGGASLRAGDPIVLVESENDPSTATRISVDYPGLANDVRSGDRIILGDGAIVLAVNDVAGLEVRATITTGGHLQGRPGVHLPAERLRLTAPTEEDLELVKHMVAADVDFIAVSFVRSGADVDKVVAAVEAASTDGRRPMVVAKIETSPAITNLFSILQATDAVMVARGDLGIECPLEDVPHLQKQVIRACVAAGVPVITATQMLESMITSPAPTRAEASDVANAVFDGTDALMLSGETAIGHDPVAVVSTMSRIAERAEQSADYRQWGSHIGRIQRTSTSAEPGDITLATTHAGWQAANEVMAAAMLCCTRSGRTGRESARFRPICPIIALSPSHRALRQLSLSWGVTPIEVATYSTTDELVWFAVQATVERGLVPSGSLVVVLAGAPDSNEGATDVLRIVRLR